MVFTIGLEAGTKFPDALRFLAKGARSMSPAKTQVFSLSLRLGF